MWDDIDKIKELTASAHCYADVIRHLNLTLSSSHYRTLKAIIQQHSIDITHFEKRTISSKGVRLNEEIFCVDSTVSQRVLRTRVIRLDLLNYKCDECGMLDEWNSRPIVLQLEHKNGVHNDNRLENLCFMCPNCHSQTATYAGKNARYKKKPEKRLIVQAYINLNETNKHTLLNSDIDFSIRGWSGKVAVLLNLRPQKVKDWMIKHMPELYEQAYHPKKRLK